MSAEQTAPALPPLEGSSPYDLRVGQSSHVSESSVKHALATGDMGFIHSFTTGSAVDGPGIRVVAWTAGCQWRCRYCHNPDTWNMTNGMPVTLERAIEGINKYRHGLNLMSGGLTLSGGEPLMQDRFVLKLSRAAKAMGVHTCIETNGYLGERLGDDELGAFDLVMLGIKTWGDQKHRQLVGKELKPTLEFAKRLAHRRRPIWIRFVLVPGLTDDPEDIKQIGKFAASLGNVERLEVLPFHQLGKYKWERLGLDYRLADFQTP
ncbi:MAG TPA: pyruvate formate-lyase-activating protein, partial [Pyrinomonadaceae bacterium]|nr:pyruvate formate-lyase-activating protein [Pyrinomonadaceae bacterium]